MSELVTWAQALDNESPDHIEVRGTELCPDDAKERQDAVSHVSTVTKHGSRVFDSSGVRLTVDRLHFVIELPSVQRDVAGRIAPIVCYGNCDTNMDTEFGVRIFSRMRDFSGRIGRDLHAEHEALVREAFIILKKKTHFRTVMKGIASAALVLAFWIAAYWGRSAG